MFTHKHVYEAAKVDKRNYHLLASKGEGEQRQSSVLKFLGLRTTMTRINYNPFGCDGFLEKIVLDNCFNEHCL